MVELDRITWTLRRAIGLIVTIGLMATVGCAYKPKHRQYSQADLIYSACASYWNKIDWLKRSGYKALVGGGGPTGTTCYPAWNRPSLDIALTATRDECRQKYGDNCFDFAYGNQLVDWAEEQSRRRAMKTGRVPASATTHDVKSTKGNDASFVSARCKRKKREYDMALSEYRDALEERDIARSMALGSRANWANRQFSAPGLSKGLAGLSVLGANINEGRTETNVEVARQRLYAAESQLCR